MEIKRSVSLIECGLGKFVLAPDARLLVIWVLKGETIIKTDIIKRQDGCFYYHANEDDTWVKWTGITDSSLIEVLNMYEILPKEDF